MRTAILALRSLLLVGALVPATSVLAQSEPLHALVDKLLTPLGGLAPSVASDGEFLRRASLDLIGMPPTADAARAFITSNAPDKRQRLIDELFASPHHVRHFANYLDLMLMERRPNTNVTADEWQAWLLKSVRENKPWSEIVKELLLADGAEPATRGPARFALDRGSDPNTLTRDIGRIFFGRDMQCAQCHDHPLVDAYMQSDYQGLFALLQPTYTITRKEGDKQTIFQAEHAGGNVTFQSVFLHVPRRTAARVPASVMIDEPFYLPGEEYQVAPAESVKSIPKFSYRQQLANLATNGANDAFNRNIANRLWALLFGRGLVQPLDMHQPNNPAANPELLQLLAQQFAVMKFDMRAFLRELALTQAYQRAFDPPANVAAVGELATNDTTRLEGVRGTLALAAKESSDAFAKATEAWEQAESAALPVAGELDTAKTQFADARKKAEEASKAAADASSQLEAKKTVATPIQQAASAAQEAIKALPADKELAEAAQKFLARAQQLSNELTALAKTAEEKKAAVAPVADAWNKTKPPVETALQKVTPLTTKLKEAESAMLAARVKADRDKEQLSAVERQLATVQKVAQLAELDRAFAAARQAQAVQEAGVAAAQRAFDEYVPLASAQETAAKVHSDTAAAAAQAVEAARNLLAKQVDAANAVGLACQALDAARQKAPDNVALADAGAKLQESAGRAQAAAADAQQKLDTATAARQTADQAVVAAQEALSKVLAERAQREKAAAAANEALAAASAEFATKQTALSAKAAELQERWAADFTIATLKPLTPEQLCWSVFRATGVYDRYWQNEVAELDKTKPLTEEQKQDAALLAARAAELEQRTYDKLKGNIGTFVTFYGAAAAQPQGDFFATADQALFVANGGPINSWVAPAGDNSTERIIKQSDPRAAADELYLGIFTRMPTDAERAEVANFLKDRVNDKAAAAQELVWALLNSAEFRFNH